MSDKYAEYDVYINHDPQDDNNNNNDDDISPVIIRRISLNDNNNNNNNNNNWNNRFQNMVLELKENIIQENNDGELECYNKLAQLAHDFTYTATLYGKVIIAEKNWSLDRKTIKPILIGGQAGGEKFCVNGILFKFADDHRGLYGNSAENAAKASNHDIRGCAHMFSADLDRTRNGKLGEGIHVPLMAVINYRGYTLTAISMLPITPDTLVYGSDRGQKPVVKDDQVSIVLEQLCHQLNIKSHQVKGVLIHTPFDMEIHRGLDGRLYALDFSRLYPCQALSKDSPKGAHLFQMLRPEFVIENSVPLSPDAFSIMGKHDAHIHNQEVILATQKLLFSKIPNFALWLLMQREYKPAHYPEKVQITNLMHRFGGINVRHLYLVVIALISAYNATNQVLDQYNDDTEADMTIQNENKQLALNWINICIVEMCCREIKAQVRDQFRLLEDTSTNTAYTHVVVKYLNKYLLTVKNGHKQSWKGRQLQKQIARDLSQNWNDLLQKVKSRFNVTKLKRLVSNLNNDNISSEMKLKLEEFEKAGITIDKRLKLFDLERALHNVSRRQMFMRLQQMLGLWFTPQVYASRSQIGGQAKDIFCEPFIDIDIVDIKEVVRDMNIVAYSEGRTLYQKGIDETGTRAIELLSLAIERYKMALSTCAVSYMYISLASAYYQLAIRSSDNEIVKHNIGLACQAGLHVAQKMNNDDDMSETATYSRKLESLTDLMRNHFADLYGPRIIRQSRGRVYGVRISAHAYLACDQTGYINVYTHVDPELYKYSRTDSVPTHNSWIRAIQLSVDGNVFTAGDHGDACIAVSKLSRHRTKPTVKPIFRMNTQTYESSTEQSKSSFVQKVLCLALVYAQKKKSAIATKIKDVSSSFESSSMSSSIIRKPKLEPLYVFADPLHEGVTPWENPLSRSYSNKIVCGLSTGVVQVWTDNGEFLGEFSAHIPSIYSISVVDHNFEIIATASEDHTVRIFDISKVTRQGKVNSTRQQKWELMKYFRTDNITTELKDELQQLSYEEKFCRPPLHCIGVEQNKNPELGHCGMVVALARSIDYLCTASFDGTIRLYEVHRDSNFENHFRVDRSGKSLRTHNYPLVSILKGHVDGVWCLRYLRQRNCLLSGSSDGTIRIWTLGEHKDCIRILSGPTSDVYSIDVFFTPWEYYQLQHEKSTKKIQRQKAREEKKRAKEEEKRKRNETKALKKALVKPKRRHQQQQIGNIEDDEKEATNVGPLSRPRVTTNFPTGVITIVAGSADESLYVWNIRDTDIAREIESTNVSNKLRESTSCNLQ